MLVAGLITVTIVAALRGVDAPSSAAALRWSLTAWCAAALGVLAKGLIGIVLPALVLLPWLLAQRRWRGIAAAAAPAGAAVLSRRSRLPWFVAMQSRYPGFFDYFFLEQHVRRYAQTGFNNVQPFWFFAPVLLLLDPAVEPVAGGAVATTHADRAGAPAGACTRGGSSSVVAFFSLPASKLVGYVLPALAPLAGLLGLAVARGRAWRWVMPLQRRWRAWPSWPRWPGAHRAIRTATSALALRPANCSRAIASCSSAAPTSTCRSMRGCPRRLIVLSDWDDPAIPRATTGARNCTMRRASHPPVGQQVLLATPIELARLLCGRGNGVVAVRGIRWQPPGCAGHRCEAGQLGQPPLPCLWRASPAPASAHEAIRPLPGRRRRGHRGALRCCWSLLVEWIRLAGVAGRGRGRGRGCAGGLPGQSLVHLRPPRRRLRVVVALPAHRRWSARGSRMLVVARPCSWLAATTWSVRSLATAAGHAADLRDQSALDLRTHAGPSVTPAAARSAPNASLPR